MELNEKDEQNKPAEFIDLFAGIGGFRQGLETSGMECVFSADNNPHAVKAYTANYGDNPECDISALDPATLPDFDIACGGFPCQPFSKAGKGEGFKDQTRGTLFFNLASILEEKKPESFIFENVKNIFTHDSGKTIKTIISTLESLGYTVSTAVLNARDFGVPQSRERVFFVGTRNNVTFDFDTLPRTRIDSMVNFLDKDTGQFEYLDESEYTLIDESQRKVQKTGLVFAGYRNKPGRNAGVNPENLHHSRNHKQPNRIYDAEGTHPTFSAQEKSGRYFILHNGRVRKLTIQECYRFMGFPEDFIRIGPKGEDYARIGNSVCVNIVREIGRELKSLRGSSVV